MQTIHITSQGITQLQELGRGACSVVYKYGPDLVIKVLNQRIYLHNFLYTLKRILCIYL